MMSMREGGDVMVVGKGMRTNVGFVGWVGKATGRLVDRMGNGV